MKLLDTLFSMTAADTPASLSRTLAWSRYDHPQTAASGRLTHYAQLKTGRRSGVSADLAVSFLDGNSASIAELSLGCRSPQIARNALRRVSSHLEWACESIEPSEGFPYEDWDELEIFEHHASEQWWIRDCDSLVQVFTYDLSSVGLWSVPSFVVVKSYMVPLDLETAGGPFPPLRLVFDRDADLVP